MKNADFIFGISDIPDTIYEIKKNYLRCEQAVAIGRILSSDVNCENYYTYSDLGIFVWLDLKGKEDEWELMLQDIIKLLNKDQDKDLIKTLKTYPDCQMNYSLTAKHLFVHINTVRKRIEEIGDLIDLDLESPISRLKLELLLRLL